MNANIQAPSAQGGDSRDRGEEIARLRTELENAAEAAEARFEPLFSWLIDLADAGPGPHVPSRAPSVRVLTDQLNVLQSLAREYQPIADEWLAKLHELIGEEPPITFPDPTLAAAEGKPVGPVDENLVTRLEIEFALASDEERIFYRWLLERAKIGAAPETNGGKVTMRAAMAAMGLRYRRAYVGFKIIKHWAPLFPGFDGLSRHPARMRLPDCDEEGTGVPTAVLADALRTAIADLGDDADHVAVLTHLLGVAEGDRTLPRNSRGVALKQIMRDAGIPERKVKGRAQAVLPDWIAFFHLDTASTVLRLDGTTDRVASHEDTLREWLDTLIDEHGHPMPLKINAKKPHGISWAWIARESRIPYRSLTQPGPQRIVLAYWTLHGPGEKYEGMPRKERSLRAARRQALLSYVKHCVDAKIALPSTGYGSKSLDFDELVRRSGIPGPTLEDDAVFRRAIGKMNPTYERARDDGGVPSNYGQLIDGIQRERVLKNNTEGSRGVTRTKVNSAIKKFYEHLGKNVSSEIGNDFERSDFKALLDEIEATGKFGKNPTNCRSELNGARKWLSRRRDGDMLADDFNDVLIAAVRRDARDIRTIIEGIDLTEGQLEGWLSRIAGPSIDTLAALKPLALRLGLEADRLHKLAGHGLRVSRRDYGGIELPKGAAEFMPDDWRSRHPEEQRAMADWINENLLHQNTMFGHTMQEVARRRNADASDGQDIVDEADNPQLPAEPLPRRDHLGRFIDRQLTTKTTGLPKQLVEELKLLRRHMTFDFPEHYLRRAGVKWKVSSTAPTKLGLLIRFLRWQTRPLEQEGLGRDPESLTLADLIHPPLVFSYIDYRARALEHVEVKGRKRGKVFTRTEADLLRTVRALVSTEFGLVTQQPNLAERMVADDRQLPTGSFISLKGHVYEEDEEEEERPGAASVGPCVMPAAVCGLGRRAFIAQCRKAELAYATAERHVDDEAEMIRDPAEPIQSILDTPQPMTTLLRQIALAGRRAPDVNRLPVQHHCHQRDMLITRLFALTALRSENLREITVGPSGKLVFDHNKGMWLLKISWREFKNNQNAILFGRRNKRQDYMKWLKDTNGLYELIDYYLKNSRPYFINRGRRQALKGGQRYVPRNDLFLSDNGRALEDDGMWQVVKRFTARHIAWNPFRESGVVLCQPFGPHAFRDIRATDILLNPETANPFLEAALALQTSPEMIQNHYGIIRTEKRTEMDDISFHKRENLAWAGLDMG